MHRTWTEELLTELVFEFLPMGQFSSLFRTDAVNVTIGRTDDDQVHLRQEDLVRFVDSSLGLPKDKSVLEKEVKSAEVKMKYQCVDTTCNFNEALKLIINISELKVVGVKELTETIVTLLKVIRRSLLGWLHHTGVMQIISSVGEFHRSNQETYWTGH